MMWCGVRRLEGSGLRVLIERYDTTHTHTCTPSTRTTHTHAHSAHSSTLLLSRCHMHVIRSCSLDVAVAVSVARIRIERSRTRLSRVGITHIVWGRQESGRVWRVWISGGTGQCMCAHVMGCDGMRSNVHELRAIIWSAGCVDDAMTLI